MPMNVRLATGTIVRLNGTACELYTVESIRLSHHGYWHVFRSLQFGNTVEGYFEPGGTGYVVSEPAEAS